MLYINNLAEINHIKSFNVLVNYTTSYLDEIDSDGGHFGFCSMEKSLKGDKAASTELLI